MTDFANPFRPGAGHMPPYLAGRRAETKEFLRLIRQSPVMENMILTGLRGVGKTVLLETLKPIARKEKWLWVGADFSESTSVREESIAIRLCTDLSVLTASIVVKQETVQSFGFTGQQALVEETLNFHKLKGVYDATPGLAVDKLKAVVELAWAVLSTNGSHNGLIFAYDEAQNLSDRSEKDEYPLSVLLDTFQSIQRKGIPVFLLLTGLPTLFPKLVEARTYSERMFRVVFLHGLSASESKEAILKPIAEAGCPVKLSDDSVETISEMSGGYPYFIQFICREVYDAFIQRMDAGLHTSVPVEEIEQKLDTDFFAGRWSRATDRQRDLLSIISQLPNCDDEFTVQEIVELSKKGLIRSFSSSHVNQMLQALSGQGLVFKNRHGKYSFAVPLLGRFIGRQDWATRSLQTA